MAWDWRTVSLAVASAIRQRPIRRWLLWKGGLQGAQKPIRRWLLWKGGLQGAQGLRTSPRQSRDSCAAAFVRGSRARGMGFLRFLRQHQTHLKTGWTTANVRLLASLAPLPEKQKKHGTSSELEVLAEPLKKLVRLHGTYAHGLIIFLFLAYLCR